MLIMVSSGSVPYSHTATFACEAEYHDRVKGHVRISRRMSRLFPVLILPQRYFRDREVVVLAMAGWGDEAVLLPIALDYHPPSSDHVCLVESLSNAHRIGNSFERPAILVTITTLYKAPASALVSSPPNSPTPIPFPEAGGLGRGG